MAIPAICNPQKLIDPGLLSGLPYGSCRMCPWLLREAEGVPDNTALITASATCGHAAGHRSPRTPLASGVAVLWPRTEARGVADAMIEADNTME